MDLKALQGQLAAGRRFEHVVDGATFRLEAPSDHDRACIFEACMDEGGRIPYARGFRALVDAALVGWEGVNARHLSPDVGDEPLPFSEAARKLLLDHRPDIANDLAVEIGARMRALREKREAARKNS